MIIFKYAIGDIIKTISRDKLSKTYYGVMPIWDKVGIILALREPEFSDNGSPLYQVLIAGQTRRYWINEKEIEGKI